MSEVCRSAVLVSDPVDMDAQLDDFLNHESVSLPLRARARVSCVVVRAAQLDWACGIVRDSLFLKIRKQMPFDNLLRFKTTEISQYVIVLSFAFCHDTLMSLLPQEANQFARYRWTKSGTDSQRRIDSRHAQGFAWSTRFCVV